MFNKSLTCAKEGWNLASQHCAVQMIRHLSWIFPSVPRIKTLSVFAAVELEGYARCSSTRSKFVQTSMAFHGNLSKEERSMMLKITGGDSLQTKPTKKEIPSTLRIRKRFPKYGIRNNQRTFLCDARVDRWLRKLELCAVDRNGGINVAIIVLLLCVSITPPKVINFING